MKPHDKIRHAHELIQLAATLLDEAASESEAAYKASFDEARRNADFDDWETLDLLTQLARNARSQADQLLLKLGRADGFGQDNELAALANLALIVS